MPVCYFVIMGEGEVYLLFVFYEINELFAIDLYIILYKVRYFKKVLMYLLIT